jgi:phage protein D
MSIAIQLKGDTKERLDISDRITGLEFTDQEKKADKAVLKVDNYDLSSYDEPLFIEGAIMFIAWGYPGNMTPTREGVIKNVKGSTQLSIETNAKSVLLHKERRCRVFENASLLGVVEQIADENGFGPDARHIEDFAGTDNEPAVNAIREAWTQARLTDAEFLRHLANKFGFEFYVDFDGLHFHPRRIEQKPIRKFIYFTDPGAGDILRPPVIEVETRGKKGSVRARGRDPMNKSDIDETADNDSEANQRKLNADTQTVISVEQGTTNISQENVASSDTVPTSEDNADAAKAVASGQFRKSQEGSVRLKFDAIGDPRVLAKSIIEVQGIGALYSGNYFVNEVKTKVGASGYAMAISATRTGKGGAGGAQVGAKAKGDKNDQAADDNDTGELTPEISVTHGQTIVRYVDKKGRDK